MSRSSLQSLLVFLLSVALYAPSLDSGFVRWDDDINLLSNERLIESSLTEPGSLAWAFKTDYVSQWRPLNWIAYVVQHQLFGLTPSGFHLVNILLHACAATLLLRIALRLRARSENECPTLSWLAALAVVLWSCHPLRVEAVSWISAQAHLLAANFLLLSYLAYLKSRSFEGGNKPLLACSFVAYSLAMLSYPTGILFPAILLLTEIGFFKTLNLSQSINPLSPPGRQAWMRLGPFAAVSIAVFGIYFLKGSSDSALYSEVADLSDSASLQSVADAAYLLGQFLLKTLAPFGLTPYYRGAHEVPANSASYLVSIGLLAVFACLAAWLGKRDRRIWGASIAYALLSLPFLGFTGPIDLPSDRYTYLNSMALALALYWVLERSLGKGVLKIAAPAMAAALIACSLNTIRYQSAWRSTESLMQRMLEVDPNHHAAWLFHQKIAEEALDQERFETSLEHLNTAIALDDQRPRLYLLRSYAHHRLGNQAAAESDLQTLERLDSKTMN
ncbi:hypothetical protein [Pelagicoccus sp. SDUM812003]|uniref:tetratricopeptide repeat protein n=1 Tax=Pelagicoccus sp. SDUM812003 TaxID=3041267 RepID=UPI00280F15FF|nr:hypothetical protein [Pelagicoccus sp. SDUM812003]MDQ8203743.1 hypothetical protein [Pelagicoccus sp. SDUM812003]